MQKLWIVVGTASVCFYITFVHNKSCNRYTEHWETSFYVIYTKQRFFVVEFEFYKKIKWVSLKPLVNNTSVKNFLYNTVIVQQYSSI